MVSASSITGLAQLIVVAMVYRSRDALLTASKVEAMLSALSRTMALAWGCSQFATPDICPIAWAFRAVFVLCDFGGSPTSCLFNITTVAAGRRLHNGMFDKRVVVGFESE